MIQVCKKNHVKRFIFASTCSNYGSNENIVNELSDVQPLSLYSECKVNSEEFILNMNTNDFETCILRFATAHGLSPRMRFDLSISDFAHQIYYKKKLEVYDPHTWRPYCHVEDISRAIIKTTYTL